MPAGSRFGYVKIFDGAGGVRWGFVDDAGKVSIDGVTSTAEFPITINNATATGSVTNTHTTSTSSTETIRNAEATTDTAVLGFSIWNRTTDSRIEYELKCGTYIVGFGGLAGQAAFNWNKIGDIKFKSNASITGWIKAVDGASTAIWHVDYKDI